MLSLTNRSFNTICPINLYFNSRCIFLNANKQNTLEKLTKRSVTKPKQPVAKNMLFLFMKQIRGTIVPAKIKNDSHKK